MNIPSGAKHFAGAVRRAPPFSCSPTVVTCGARRRFAAGAAQRRETLDDENGGSVLPRPGHFARREHRRRDRQRRRAKAKTLRLYDIATERKLAHYDLGIENGDRLVFSPDGGSLLIGFYDGTGWYSTWSPRLRGPAFEPGLPPIIGRFRSGRVCRPKRPGFTTLGLSGPMTEEAMVYPWRKGPLSPIDDRF